MLKVVSYIALVLVVGLGPVQASANPRAKDSISQKEAKAEKEAFKFLKRFLNLSAEAQSKVLEMLGKAMVSAVAAPEKAVDPAASMMTAEPGMAAVTAYAVEPATATLATLEPATKPAPATRVRTPSLHNAELGSSY